MTAALAPVDVDHSQSANAWIMQNYTELRSRARACFAYCEPGHREEAIAETVAASLAAAHSAARRGKLDRITPYWLVIFATRQFRSGRRFAGTSSVCVMSEATRLRRGVRVVSLDQDVDPVVDQDVKLREALADGEAEDPFDVVRREHDYPAILEAEAVSSKAWATFRFLAETRGSGKQADLADELRVSPGRITQLKRELGEALERHEYAGPLNVRR